MACPPRYLGHRVDLRRSAASGCRAGTGRTPREGWCRVRRHRARRAGQRLRRRSWTGRARPATRAGAACRGWRLRRRWCCRGRRRRPHRRHSRVVMSPSVVWKVRVGWSSMAAIGCSFVGRCRSGRAVGPGDGRALLGGCRPAPARRGSGFGGGVEPGQDGGQLLARFRAQGGPFVGCLPAQGGEFVVVLGWVIRPAGVSGWRVAAIIVPRSARSKW